MPRPDIEDRRKDSREYAARRLAEDPDYHKKRRAKCKANKAGMTEEQKRQRKRELEKARNKKYNDKVSAHRARLREKLGTPIKKAPDLVRKRQLPGPGITLRVHARPSKALTVAWKEAEMTITKDTKFTQGPSFTGDRWGADLEASREWGKR